MNPHPIVYSGTADDLRSAVASIRERFVSLAEPRMYTLAVLLTILSRSGRATQWRSWEAAPPSRAVALGRQDLVWALGQLFSTSPDGLLRLEAAARAELGEPSSVMLDLFYDPQKEPLTLVGNKRPQGGRRNAIKMRMDDPGWIWSEVAGSGDPGNLVEHNPDNTRNQQNGVTCGLAAADSLGQGTGPAATYAILRNDCPYHQDRGSDDPLCVLNSRGCGGMGGGAGARETTKPRLIVPARTGEDAALITPGAIETLISQATGGQKLLPKARDLAFVASWLKASGVGLMDDLRLLRLLGEDGIALLTEQS